MTELSNQNSIKSKWEWFLDLFRYFTASFITWISVSIPPILLLIIIFGLSTFAILSSWISFLFLGGEIEEGLQVVFWFVVAPILLILLSIVAFFAIMLFSGIFTFTFVLPLSYFSEVVNGKVFSSSLFGRISGVFITSVFIGIITCIATWFFSMESEKNIRLFWVLISFCSTTFAFSLFGTIITFIKTVSSYIIKRSKK